MVEENAVLVEAQVGIPSIDGLLNGERNVTVEVQTHHLQLSLDALTALAESRGLQLSISPEGIVVEKNGVTLALVSGAKCWVAG
jgi:hypothetical protein